VKLRRIVAALALLSPLLAQGAEAPVYPAELPPAERVRQALAEAPDVRAAASLLDAGLATRRQLIAGPQEWSARVDHARRRASEGGETERTTDWELGLERPLRSGTKAGLDRQVGDTLVTEAELALADARHELGRELLGLWYDWIRASAVAGLLREQAAIATREASVVERRVGLGDASVLDLSRARASAGEAEAAARAAASRADGARIVLARRCPGLADLAPPRAPTPVELPADFERLGRLAVDEDHGLLLARAAAARGAAESRRVAAERRPDPTVGVRVARERSGADTMVGLYLSIPLAGESRRAAADASLATAAGLERRAEAVQRRLQAEVGALVRAIQASRERWLASEGVAEMQASVAARLERAHALGEAGLGEVLLARRQASQAAVASLEARVDALERLARLLLDAHVIWDYD